MLYNLVSIERIIGKILRDTRIQDTAYTADMYEWIPEAMQMLQTRNTPVPAVKDVKITFHRGSLPLAITTLVGCAYNGTRMVYRDGVVNIEQERKLPYMYLSRGVQRTTVNDTKIWDNELWLLPESTTEWYNLNPGCIVSSIESGTIRVFYTKMPHDERGFPLVPDNTNYQEAVYWFVRAKLIGTGHKDSVYGNDDRLPLERFEQYAGRAINEIRYPTTDMLDKQVLAQTRLIAAQGYWESFGNELETEPLYGDF